MMMDEPGSATTLASSVVITIELFSITKELCITMFAILDESTASEKFNNSEPELRSKMIESSVGCIISD